MAGIEKAISMMGDDAQIDEVPSMSTAVVPWMPVAVSNSVVDGGIDTGAIFDQVIQDISLE